MRQPPTGSRLPTSCEKPDVSGEKMLLALGAQASDDRPPARSTRKARRPYGRASSITAVRLRHAVGVTETADGGPALPRPSVRDHGGRFLLGLVLLVLPLLFERLLSRLLVVGFPCALFLRH